MKAHQRKRLAGPNPHFVIRGVELPGEGIAPGYKVEVDGADIVLRRGSLPFVTVREYAGGGRVVWLGTHRPTAELGKQFARNLLKRALVWTQRSLL